MAPSCHVSHVSVVLALCVGGLVYRVCFFLHFSLFSVCKAQMISAHRSPHLNPKENLCEVIELCDSIMSTWVKISEECFPGWFSSQF